MSHPTSTSSNLISTSFLTLSLLSLSIAPSFTTATLGRRHHNKMHRHIESRGGLLSGVVGQVGDLAGGTVKGLGDTVSKLGGGGGGGGGGGDGDGGANKSDNIVSTLGDTVSNVGGSLQNTVNKVAGTGGGKDNGDDGSDGGTETGGGSSGSNPGGGSNAGGGSGGSPSTGGGGSTPGASAGHGSNGSGQSGSSGTSTGSGGNTSGGGSSGGNTDGEPTSGDSTNTNPDGNPGTSSGNSSPNGSGGGAQGGSATSPSSEDGDANGNDGDVSADSPPINKAVVSGSDSSANDGNGASQNTDGAGQSTNGESAPGNAAGIDGDTQASVSSAASSLSGVASPASSGTTPTTFSLPTSSSAAAADHSNSSSQTKNVVIPVVVVLCILALAIFAFVVRKRSKSRRAIQLAGADFTPVNRPGNYSPTPAMGVAGRRVSEESFVAGRPTSAYTVGAQSEMSQRSYGNGNPFAAPLTSHEPYTDANPLFYDPATSAAGVADLTNARHAPQSQSFFESSDSINGYNTATDSGLYYDGSAEGGSAAMSYSSHGMDLASTAGAPLYYSPYPDVHRSSIASANSTSESSHDRHYRIRTSRLEPYADAEDPFADQAQRPQAAHSNRWSS